MTSTQEIILTIREYYSQRKISYPALREMGLNASNFKEYLWERLEEYDAAGIRQIYRMATNEETLTKYPKDWWQHTKERWMPKVLLKYFPVQYTEIVALHKFPHWERELGKEYVEVLRRRV